MKTGKIRVLIIEDLEKTVNAILEIFEKHCPMVEVVGVAGEVNAGYELILEKKPDLVLSDIQIVNGTGFDIIQKLLDNNIDITFEVIFMTGHIEYDYAAKAFQYSAIYYFSKPFGFNELITAISKVEKIMSMKEAREVLDGLMLVIKKEGSISDFIAVHLANKKIRRIPIDQILYLEADTVMTDFYLTNGEKIIAFKNLGQYRQILELDHNFFSIKNSICVNLAHKADYNHSTFEMTMKNGKVLQGSRDFCKKYYAFMKEMGEETRIEKKTLLENIKKFFGL